MINTDIKQIKNETRQAEQSMQEKAEAELKKKFIKTLQNPKDPNLQRWRVALAYRRQN